MALSVDTRRKGAIAEINVTPMADVMIVLLIIFMVTAPIIAQAPVRLPAARHGTDHGDGPLEIVVRSSGELSLGGTAFASVEALTGYLEARRLLADRAPVVMILADREARYSDVARALGACRRAGVSEVGLAAERGIP